MRVDVATLGHMSVYVNEQCCVQAPTTSNFADFPLGRAAIKRDGPASTGSLQVASSATRRFCTGAGEGHGCEGSQEARVAVSCGGYSLLQRLLRTSAVGTSR